MLFVLHVVFISGCQEERWWQQGVSQFWDEGVEWFWWDFMWVTV